jgi:hypothetical protein
VPPARPPACLPARLSPLDCACACVLQDPGCRRTTTAVVKQVAQRDGTAPVRWRLRLYKRTQQQADRRISFKKCRKEVSSSDFVSLVGGQHSLGPWDTEREAVAQITRFHNLVEFGQERRPHGPPQNAVPQRQRLEPEDI